MPILQTEIPLPASPPVRYTGMAYDGAHFYFTKSCGNEICSYSCRYEPECCYKTCRNYTSICYDPEERCFWAASDQCREVLFKLNGCFQEIDCIPASVPGYCCDLGPITGVSYDCGCHRLVAAYPTCVVAVNQCRKEENALLVKSGCGWILGVLSVCPYLACCCMDGGRQMIRLYSPLGGLLEEYELACDGTVEAAVFLPACDCCDAVRLAVLACRHGCYSYVWDFALPCGILPEPICPECCRPCEQEPCRCGQSPCRCGPHCGRDCSEILDCTAQLEKAIACILSTEGEKLKKILDSSEDPAELLAANRSVQNTIVKATHFEQMLFDLLEEYRRNEK